MSSTIVFSSKTVDTSRFLVFDYISQLLSEETIVSAGVTVSVVTGIDPMPSDLALGLLAIDQTEIFQEVHGGIAGVIYNISCAATTDLANVIIMQGKLAVLNDNPF